MIMNSSKSYISTFFLCVFLLLSHTVNGANDKPIILKIEAAWPSGTLLYDNLIMLAGSVEKMSGGRLKIEAYPAGAIVPVSELLNAVSNGVIDGAHSSPGFYVSKDRAIIPLSHGPLYGMDTVDMFSWMYTGQGLGLLNEYYQTVLKSNVISFPIGGFGGQAFGWFKNPIKDWDSIKGTKIRIYGLGADIYPKLGMSIVTLPAGEILPAGERGLIDAAEFTGGKMDLQLGFPKVWKNYYVPSILEQVSLIDVAINKNVWEKLAPDLQAIFKAAVIETFWLSYAITTEENAKAVKEMTKDYKVKVYKTPINIDLKILELTDQVAKEDYDKNPFYKKVVDAQKEYAKKIVPYRLSNWLPYDFIGNYYWKDEVYSEESPK